KVIKVYLYVLLTVLCSILLVYMFIHVLVSHTFDYCSSSLVSFEISKSKSSNFVLFQNCFGNSGPPAIPHELESAFSILQPLPF
uniref:Uncharacterized protein n=1 Tax=Balaenoptera musculus TaxID=9771 RepID=A0A8C0DKQ1_BALMU